MTRSFQAGCIAIAMLIFSCKKDVQTTALPETATAPKGSLVSNKCDIVQMTTTDLRYGTRTISFDYNKKGDPVSVTPSIIEEGSPQLLFRYNNKGQLTDFIVAISNTTFSNWYQYIYDKNTAIGATVNYFGTIGDVPTNVFLTGTVSFTYDAQGRITEVTQTGSIPIEAHTYEYDANGNVVLTNQAYDNQVNLARTSQVWMFVSRNYSRNNVIPATSYNSAGLPLSFNAPTSSYPFAFFLRYPLNLATVEYSCKGNVN